MIQDGLLSIVIPARNEKYLKKTIEDLLSKASDQIEIIAVLDGYWPPYEEIVEDKRVRYINFGEARGMRNAINSGVAIAKGEYIMKIDAHCLMSSGYDVELKQLCGSTDILIPRRLRLDPEKWEVINDGRPPIDYMYLTYPGGMLETGLHGAEWRSKNEDLSLKNKNIDDLMSFQGSFWFMKRDYFDFLELMDEENYGSFASEAQEIGLKCQLSGGHVLVVKTVTYAHWHKDKESGRGYPLNNAEYKKAGDFVNQYMADGMTRKVWHKQTIPLRSIIQNFNPPGWPKI